MKRLFRVASFLIKLGVAYVIAFFLKCFNAKYRNIWIISERGDDARDNGYVFFKYLRENHPQQRIIYVIKSSSADFDKVKALGEWVEFQSFSHFVFYALSRVRLSTHTWGGDLPYADYLKHFMKKVNKRRPFVWLKHGIDKDYNPPLMADRFFPSLLVCGAKPEYDYEIKTYNHQEGVLQYTGFARFDNLLGEHKVKNQILVMPTFRKWLNKAPLEKVQESEYLKAYNQLLGDKRLYGILEQNDLDLIFYPHYVMQRYIDLFTTKSDRIKIAKFADYDVQQLLIESKLLVTDFSSVFFDFGYMDKPTVYYQFDRDRYIKEHYDFTKGYFSYDRDGFGEVVFDHNDLIDQIEKYVKANFKLSNEYQKRINAFFPLKDTNNCKRIYDRIIEITKK